MAYQTAQLSTTLSDPEGHSPIASFSNAIVRAVG